MDVRFPRTEISALDCVLKQPAHRIPVILIILGRIDPTLRRNRMSPSRTILETERFHLITQLRQTGRRRGPRQPRPYHNHFVLPLIRRTNQSNIRLKARPLLRQWPRRNSSVEFHNLRTPARTANGIELNPKKSTAANIQEPISIKCAEFRSRNPKVCQTLAAPCRKWEKSSAIATT